MCTAVGATSHWHGLEGCTMCDISGNMLKNNKAVMNLCALISWKNSSEGFMWLSYILSKKSSNALV
jgi:hypothetical protein